MRRRRGLSLQEAFEGFKERHQALQAELALNFEEWHILAELIKQPMSEMQLAKRTYQKNVGSLLAGLFAKGYVAKQEDGSGTEWEYLVTEQGWNKLQTIRERFGAVVAEHARRADPSELNALYRSIKLTMRMNGIPFPQPRRRSH
jgi:DNA-binding MarR family transcriptional regulator